MRKKSAKMMMRIGSIAAVTLSLCLANATGEPIPEESSRQIQLISLTGMWTGTVHMEEMDPTEYNPHIILRIYEDGSFFCPTHDLVWLQDDQPSNGTIMQAEDMLTFWAPQKISKDGQLFRYNLVLREARNPETPPRLYLLDKPHGVAIHLSLSDAS